MQPITPVAPDLDLPETVIAKDQPQYTPLPCYRDPNDPYGTITIRWKLTWAERFEVLFSGCIWHQVMTFNKRLQPIKMHTICPLQGSPWGKVWPKTSEE